MVQQDLLLGFFQRHIIDDFARGLCGEGSGIVAAADDLDALQAVDAPGFGPAAVVADQHADDGVAFTVGGSSLRSTLKIVFPKGVFDESRSSECFEPEISRPEVAFLELLEGARSGVRFDGAGEVDFAVLTHYLILLSRVIHVRVVVDVRSIRLDVPFGVADTDIDTQFVCEIEKPLDAWGVPNPAFGRVVDFEVFGEFGFG